MEVVFEALVEQQWRDAATVSHEDTKRPARRDLRDKGDRG
jgi:hypothetical protein